MRIHPIRGALLPHVDYNFAEVAQRLNDPKDTVSDAVKRIDPYKVAGLALAYQDLVQRFNTLSHSFHEQKLQLEALRQGQTA